MNPEPLRIVHITDTHIIAEPGAEVYGIDSFAALENLLAGMQRDAWTPHLLIDRRSLRGWVGGVLSAAPPPAHLSGTPGVLSSGQS